MGEVTSAYKVLIRNLKGRDCMINLRLFISEVNVKSVEREDEG
jgi:hypothetical protein